MKGMFLFQSGGLAEHSFDEVATTLASGGIDTLYVKAADGATWEGHWDGGFGAINGLDNLKQWRDALAPKGVSLIPWVQPDAPGFNVSRSAVVGVCSLIANEFEEVVLDIEPGSDYWEPIDVGDYSGVAPFFRDLRVASGSNKLVVCYPGGWAMEEMVPFIAAADPYVDGYQSQDYWDVAKLLHDESRLRTISAKPLDHVIATFGSFTQQLAYLAGRGEKRVIVWDFAHMNAALYNLLAAFDGKETPPTTGNWIGDGFIHLKEKLGDAMGNSTEPPRPDNEGNVFQPGDKGDALWYKRFNTNIFIGADGSVQTL